MSRQSGTLGFAVPWNPEPERLARPGARVARMKFVKAVTSTPNGAAAVAASSGSATPSKAATELPFEVFSVGCKGLVMPISLR